MIELLCYGPWDVQMSTDVTSALPAYLFFTLLCRDFSPGLVCRKKAFSKMSDAGGRGYEVDEQGNCKEIVTRHVAKLSILGIWICEPPSFSLFSGWPPPVSCQLLDIRVSGCTAS